MNRDNRFIWYIIRGYGSGILLLQIYRKGTFMDSQNVQNDSQNVK
jgi:hypothetical protein